ncbi:hypothetical protein, partial [Tritonibacter sp. SIMBA_163]|uniref:hypothetical protein n=1 Tax=Tritonibacter sp. SIMBA_163 TaxID=3080868 RepID=UPI00397FCED9
VPAGGGIASLDKFGRFCGWNLFSVLVEFALNIRRRALGWPLAISQEEHLSYCIGSPLYAGRL